MTQQQKSHKINVILNPKEMKKINVLPLKRGCPRGKRHPTTVKGGCLRHQTTLKTDGP